MRERGELSEDDSVGVLTEKLRLNYRLLPATSNSSDKEPELRAQPSILFDHHLR